MSDLKFSPEDFTFEDFKECTGKALASFDFLEQDLIEQVVEDSVPWINLQAKRVIKPEEALEILVAVQSAIVDQVLFHSLSGREMRIVINGKFHDPGLVKGLAQGGFDFDEEYALDFGVPVDEFKKEYGLMEKKASGKTRPAPRAKL